MLDELNRLADEIVRDVMAFVAGGAGSAVAIEQKLLRGISASLEAIDELTPMLDSARARQQQAEVIDAALVEVEQKLAFFQGCTMRRSSARAAQQDPAFACAEEAERIAAEARARATIDDLVVAYKAVEGIEAQVIALRGKAKTGIAPELRILDLPRARVLVARRTIGAAIVGLDADDG